MDKHRSRGARKRSVADPVEGGELMQDNEQAERLSSRVKVLYGVADCGAAMLMASIRFFLLFFYTDVLGIDPALAGTALLVGKLTWDAINDPVFGYLSDRTRTRLGRRRPYMLAGAVPLGLSAWLLYSIPAGLTGTAAFFTILGSFLLLDTMFTMVHVAYVSLTPELTRDYEERTSLTAVRMMFSAGGYILGAAGTMAISRLFQDTLGWSEKAAYSGVGAVFGLIATAAVLTTALTIRERPSQEIEPSRLPPLAAVWQTFRNGPFMRLVGAYFVSNVGFALLTSLLPYFLTYQLDMKAQVSIVLFAMLATIVVCIYPWKMVAGRLNKGPSYALGLFIASLAVLSTFVLPYGRTFWVYPIALVAGLGFSAQWVFPWSMLPDVVEYDERQTGERREGVYYGVWALLTKLGDALGIAISGWALNLFGYVPNVAQTETARLGIRLFFGPVPVLLIFIGLPLLIWYPITKASHARLRAELEGNL
jgi:GPH family glycoside/pentoside/hexuronide:cation symporter